MATAVDVTEQRRMEEVLRESEKRYRALAESAPDIIFLVDMEGNALYVNSAGGRLLDREPGALQGMNVREMFPPRIAERWVAMLRKAAEPAAGSLTEETLLPDDGGAWRDTPHPDDGKRRHRPQPLGISGTSPGGNGWKNKPVPDWCRAGG